MRHIAPPQVNGLELYAIKNSILLVEYEDFQQIQDLLSDPDNTILAFSLYPDDIRFLKSATWCPCNTISRAARLIKTSELAGPNVKFLIHRIDFLDNERDKRSRGSLRKGMLSTFSHHQLKGANIIITSREDEFMLRDLADRFINLKTQTK